MEDGRTRPGGVIDDRFLLKHQLGGGGAATVWCATDLETREDVALKLLHPRYRGIDEAHERLAREAALLSSFTHPHIARAHAFELDRIQPYFVMRLISGESLEDRLATRSANDDFFPWAELLRLVEQICSAVDYAHAHGVVHRDLKPSNIMLDSQAQPPDVRILDFGIAKLLAGGARNPTTQGRVMGTGFYMAPEQARGDSLDPRADLFALGVVVFEMTTLRRAWVRNDRGGPVRAFAEPARRNEFNTPGAILSRISQETRPRPSDFRRGLAPAIDAAITWPLAIEPDDRPASAAAFFDELYAAVAAIDASAERFVSTLKDDQQLARPAVDATWSRSRVDKPQASRSKTTGDLMGPPDRTEPAERMPALGRPGHSQRSGHPDGAYRPDRAVDETRRIPTEPALSEDSYAFAPRVGGTAADPRVQAAIADTKPTPLGASPPPSPTPDQPVSVGHSWHDLGTVVGEGGMRSSVANDAHMVAEQTRTAVDPANAPTTAIAPPDIGDPGVGARDTNILLGPTAVGPGPDPTPPMRAIPSARVGQRFSTVPLIVMGAVTVGLLFGFLLGRQGQTPTRKIVWVEGPKRGAFEGPQVQPRPIEPVPDIVPPPSPPPSPPTAGAQPDRRADVTTTAPRRVRRRRTSAKPKNPVLVPLQRLMRQARSDPSDLGLLTRLGKAIETSARKIDDPSERDRIQRIARSSAMLGDVDGVNEALDALAKALR